MRYGITFTLFAAFVFAGCSSTRSAPTKTARAPQRANTLASSPAQAAYRPTAAPVRRTRTVTARPVAKALTRRSVARPFESVGAPSIPHASTQRYVPTSLTPIRYSAPALRPASRPASVRRPASLESMAKPIAPLAVPGLEQCIGDECGVPCPAYLDD